jgi:hypothetical protein
VRVCEERNTTGNRKLVHDLDPVIINALIDRASQEVPPLDLALYYEGNRRGSIISNDVLAYSEKDLALTLLALADKCRVGSLILLVLSVAQEFPQAQQLSGRALRRLPVLALARYIGTGVSTSSATATSSLNNSRFQTGIRMWLDAMDTVLTDRAADHGKLA